MATTKEILENNPAYEITDEKMNMAKTLIALPGWDGNTDPEWLCKNYSGDELADALDAYEIEFSDPQHFDTDLELTENQKQDIYAAQNKYDAVNTKRVSLKLNKRYDSDILKWLEKQDSRQGAIKEAIRFFIKKQKSRTRK